MPIEMPEDVHHDRVLINNYKHLFSIWLVNVLAGKAGWLVKLAGKCVFSKLHLCSAYWQFPMQKESIEKTAFFPGPGYGLWEFTVMPYGLTGATQTYQQRLDTVLHDCKYCVDNYV